MMRENLHLKYETRFISVSNSREPQETWLGSTVAGIESIGHKEVGTHGENFINSNFRALGKFEFKSILNQITKASLVAVPSNI